MYILGIETSCDETAASVVLVENDKFSVLSNVVSSQIDIHKKFGGVVPEIAARQHIVNIIPVINQALADAGFSLDKFKFRRGLKINYTNIQPIKKIKEEQRKLQAIAVTEGPGLITSLIVGTETAKALSYAWQLPLVSVNHIEGHILANFLNNEKIEFPALVLTVSGGHTTLVLMEDVGEYKVIGETRDDAAGEAFDKAAKLMDIGYPGGPIVAAEAEKFYSPKIENRHSVTPHAVSQNSKITLPRPMINSGDFDFSFSGLKTALFYDLKKDKDWKNKIPQYCAEFQQAVIDVLTHKTIKAAEKYNVNTIMLAGGVAANQELRRQLAENVKRINKKFIMPDLKYTTDNATMIAVAGYFKLKQKQLTPWQNLKAQCNLKFNR